LERVTFALHPASFDLKIVNILHQTMVYAASIHTGPRLSVAEVMILSLMFSQAVFLCPHYHLSSPKLQTYYGLVYNKINYTKINKTI
jgi:hypothetical protein